MANASQFVRRHPDTASRNVDDETLILNPADGKIITLNATASHIWNVLGADRMTLAQIVASLRQEFDVDEAQAEADVRAFVAEMAAKGAILVETV